MVGPANFVEILSTNSNTTAVTTRSTTNIVHTMPMIHVKTDIR